MPILKKIAIGIISLALLVLLLNFGISYWLEKKLPSVLQSDKKFPYNISYDDLDISLISGSLTAHNVYLAQKDTTNSSPKQGAFGKIRSVNIQNLDLWALW
ncbi:hypothetical protein CHU92_08245 [Flavobacterium cyanobacteriorum]|uniref:Uncharacterized protein n=1 Tax=Flavobacterium cyanobacteriorum TaxID=2022802 RepID=A0A255Z7K7_9FLAO|nr:hypothetical protein [Flavobacterium cyanobacteriorum]OYQ37458.1 hypothetical protein CHU92_08245 [Flavobacterium cyanobacteriorum]